MGYKPIEDYAVIGDLHTVALVGIDGSIDFMCVPHFDSPTVFAALLDDKKGGSWKLQACMEEVKLRQMYLPDSCIVMTRFMSEAGVGEVVDFMTAEEDVPDFVADHALVRHVKTVRGEVRFRMIFAPRFNYARSGHKVEREADGAILFVPEEGGQEPLRLRASVPVEIQDGTGFAEFALGTGKVATFVMEPVIAGRASESVRKDYPADAFKQTLNFWRRWVGRSSYKGRWRETVNRSALTLKLLTSQRYGSIVAAPTFGLPEHVGGVRNWDYRYTWLRDASFTLYALMRLGYSEEASAFMGWLSARSAEMDGGQLQLMYGIDGRRELIEEELPHLEGYRGSKPVRIGNAAFGQSQMDIYGALMDAVYLYDKHVQQVDHDSWVHLCRMVDYVIENRRRPDHGIWEVRGGEQEFLFSRLMCWVAVDRAVRLAHKRSRPAPVDRWVRARNEMYDEIFREFRRESDGAFVQSRGSTALDASALLMPLVKFVAPQDPIWLKTLRAIEKELVDDSLVFRYHPSEAADDGLGGNEGTFSMCSFWYVECLSRAGDLQQARFIFEKMLGYANHVGLYAEELGPRGEHLGNFPQAFTHLALISAAFDLNRRLDHAERGPEI